MTTCPSCGQELPGEFPFCPFCGASLTEQPAPSLHEERKVVTVLFCDLVGFTAASEAADPEDVRSRIRPYHARLRREIERYGGTRVIDRRASRPQSGRSLTAGRYRERIGAASSRTSPPTFVRAPMSLDAAASPLPAATARERHFTIDDRSSRRRSAAGRRRGAWACADLGLGETGATGLEPAISGVTGRVGTTAGNKPPRRAPFAGHFGHEVDRIPHGSVDCRSGVWATIGPRRSMIRATLSACRARCTFASTTPRPPRSR